MDVWTETLIKKKEKLREYGRRGTERKRYTERGGGERAIARRIRRSEKKGRREKETNEEREARTNLKGEGASFLVPLLQVATQ
jgi:hypothetical protein